MSYYYNVKIILLLKIIYFLILIKLPIPTMAPADLPLRMPMYAYTLRICVYIVLVRNLCYRIRFGNRSYRISHKAVYTRSFPQEIRLFCTTVCGHAEKFKLV